MTRKDYVLIAAAISDSKCMYAGQSPEYARGVRTQFQVTAQKIAAALQSDNPRFDRARFLKACGISE